MEGIKIIGAGSAKGDIAVTNGDMEKLVDTSDEWIRSKSGIRSRFFAENLSNADMAYEAAREALEDAAVLPEEIYACIVCTFTPDNHTPGVSCEVAGRLGLPENVLSFDINGACSGFIYGCAVAAGLAAGLPDKALPKYILVIGSEKISPLVDMTDRSTCVLFGDGAGAVVIERDPASPFSYHSGLISDSRVLRCDGKEHRIRMEGQEVYRFAVSKASLSIRELMKKQKLSDDDIDYYVCHQANERIIDNVARRIKGSDGKFFKNLYIYGNTSAASIPIAIADMRRQGLLNSRKRLICAGFGAGLTYGSMYIEFEQKRQAENK